MIPKLGEVWSVDMGIAGKVRPAVVILDDSVPVERTLIVYVPISTQNRGTSLEISLGHLRFLSKDSTANIQAIGSLPKARFERRLGVVSATDLEKIRQAMRLAFGL